MNINNTIKGHLDIFSASENEDNSTEIFIHGDPDGLRSLANILLELAEHNQEIDISLPIGSREHTTLNPDVQLSKSSDYVTIGRLDAKGTQKFYDKYLSRDI